MSADVERETWEANLREAFSHALAETMGYLRNVYGATVIERDQLRERVKYLEQRLDEERKR